MRLKRLVVRGFKSFADRTEFDFDHALTGIVGPNGCGKSNVVDALKWVLGDQRARSLRGKEMLDVIFKGAEGRDAMSVAEVEIGLEDPEGRLDGRTEVRIGRRLTSDHESDYLLNGSVARLRDVRDFLLDTGLGVGAYSVMEQGRIDAVLSANPEERRAIFEEAAGISRYKLQKRETLRKLEHTDQNLARVKDLLEERAKRIRSLKVQAGRARRWREIRALLADLKAAVAVVEAQALQRQREELGGRLQGLERELEAEEARLGVARAQLEAADARIAERARGHETLQGRSHELRSGREAALAQAQQKAHRAEELAADGADAQARHAGVLQQRQQRVDAVAAGRQRLAELETAAIALDKELDLRRQAARDAQQELKAAQAGREAMRERVLESVHQRTKLRNLAHEQETQLRTLDGRRARLDEKAETVQRELEAVQGELAGVQTGLETLEQRRLRLQEDAVALEAELAATQQQVEVAVQADAAQRRALATVQGRLHALEAMEQQMQGVDDGPRWLLENKPAGLVGRLLDQVLVDVEHGSALEAALGPLQQALVVDTRAHAQAMLAALRDAGRGRATLIVLEDLGGGPDDAVLEPPAGARPLHRVVRHKDDVVALVRWALRGACLVDSVGEAPAERQDLCFVSPAGDVACGPRREGGAATGSGGGLVVRRLQIQQLAAEAGRLAQGLAALEARREAAARCLDGLEQRKREQGEAVQAVVGAEQEGRAQIGRHEGRRADLERERATIALELREIATLRSSAIAGLGRCLLDLMLAARCEAVLLEREATAAARSAAAQQAQAEATRLEQELQLRQVAASGESQAQAEAIALHEHAQLDLERTAADLEQRAADAAAGATRARGEAVDLERRATELETGLGAVLQERDAVAALLAADQQQRKQLAEDAQRLERERGERQDQRTQGRLDRQELEHRFTRLEERLRDETGIELRRLLGEIDGHGLLSLEPQLPAAPAELLPEQLLGPPLPPEQFADERALQRLWLQADFAADDARQKADALDGQLARLGPVNVAAERELVEEEEGFERLEAQVEDLTEARAALLETMRRLEEESRALFERTFEAARKNFHEIFRKLFQGGRADMTLVAGEDMLEAGIEIVARPPGKELQSINLLSGGERSLTALAILFAVFKVKPSPFCILDEVDAALDETNVERFLRVLQDFVGPTQFCVVTHHKRTMAACQVLYGITMQKKGVSSRIAVALDEVDALKSGAGTAGADMSLATRQRIAGEEGVGF
jgi:chromosome segregation protein